MKKRLQLDPKDGDTGVNSFQIDDFQNLAYFTGAEIIRIEAVFTGILIAFLTAALSFVLY